MKTQFKYTLAVLAALSITPAYAIDAPVGVVNALADVATKRSDYKPACDMKETGNLNVRWDRKEMPIAEARTYLETEMQKVKAIAADVGLNDLQIQNSNYSINTDRDRYNNTMKHFFHGNVSFQFEDADKAAMLMEKLVDAGYQANLNVNAYNQCR